jgi:hypothetical protein
LNRISKSRLFADFGGKTASASHDSQSWRPLCLITAKFPAYSVCGRWLAIPSRLWPVRNPEFGLSEAFWRTRRPPRHIHAPIAAPQQLQGSNSQHFLLAVSDAPELFLSPSCARHSSSGRITTHRVSEPSRALLGLFSTGWAGGSSLGRRAESRPGRRPLQTVANDRKSQRPECR